MGILINLKDKKGIILGIANEKSIAWGIAEKLKECGAQLAFSYVNESIKKRLKPLAEKCNSSLSDNFPDTKLRNEIETRGTIGDWLRKHEESIRKI